MKETIAIITAAPVTVRTVLGLMLVPVMMATGFRFSKEYRWGSTALKAFVYRHIDTVTANLVAGL